MAINPSVNDVELQAKDVRSLENADRVAHLFARLGYRVDDRTKITNLALLGLDSADVRQHIRNAELLAKDSSGEIVVYLFEVRSITAKLRNDIARAFRERPEHALLVLTKDYTTLEFVFLDVQTKERKGIQASQGLALRPIPLSVNRLEPDPIAVRILRRFTFTEADEGYQWEKLHSAYVLAQWTEEYFNNRALFSDYYLKNRLPDLPEWGADLSFALNSAHDLLVGARSKFSGKPESEARKALFEPLFSLLGFEAEVVKDGSSDGDEPDYQLYMPGDRSKPVAAALTYVWNRNLDDRDESRDFETQDEIPGAQVVSLLEKQVAPWVIVTNGKLWRLYSATASNKATNYYEIDLEEALAATEQVTALKYWWLLFRAGAFTGFLDRLLSGSAQYAKDLGDRLKERVFVEIFPQFARGFIAHMRAEGMAVTEADLPPVFSATMTFLYRLMFILYAESLDLLPVVEPNGYAEASLQRLKQEIAEAGKRNEDNAPDLLRKHYTTGSAALYDRLKALFTMIDQGAEAQNLPAYNGGLFSPASPEGRFLDQYAIPDQYLALGLDRLTRDEDDKTKELVFIDFKSLGVRHLGSIYEGLLEFKLRIAAEPLAEEMDGKREVYVPLKGAKTKDAKAAVNKGDVYLENDRKERKTSGSFYTPDYIVKYIVQHAVGPVLDRKFEELRPRLHAAQRDYRNFVKLVDARGNDQPYSLFWNNGGMRQLVDDCLNVRVLDPAMGSGHFLVEVVDYVSNRLIDFLNGWSENPVWAALEVIRRNILDDMDKQKVTIDASRLTRVALLKRAVLKRCVYGVDLNLMAVELAKVSLWLDAFTLGAPLSFLDHHLKWGNSLIGAMDMSNVVAVGSKRWELILDAAADMVALSKRTDSTVSEVGASRASYEAARTKVDDVKKYANVPIAAHFVDKLVEYRKSKSHSDIIGQIAQIAYGTRQEQPLQALYSRAQATAEEKRFFHWRLEFPEVFIDLDKRTWAVDGGFDAVVGNPPWVDVQDVDESIKPYLRDAFVSTKGKFDLYGVFVEHSLALLNLKAIVSMVFQSKFLVTEYGEGLRKALATKSRIFRAVQISVSGVFDGITTYPFILVAGRSQNSDTDIVLGVVVPSNRSVQDVQRILGSDLDAAEFSFEFSQSTLHEDSYWSLEPVCITELAAKLVANSKPFSEYVESIGYGVKTNLDPAYIASNDYWAESQVERELLRQAFKPRDISRFELDYDAPLMLFPYVDGESLELVDISKFPNARNHFSSWRGQLERRRFFGKTVIEHGMQYYELPYVSSHSRRPKLVFPTVTDRSTFAFDAGANLFIAPCYVVYLKQETSHHYLLAVLNSTLMNFQLKRRSTDLSSGYMEMQKQYIEGLPIYPVSFTTSATVRTEWLNETVGAYSAGTDASVLEGVRAALTACQSDVVHDLLAHLAGQMIHLHEKKQAEVRRFLTWLEGTLHIIAKKSGETGLDSLNGKTILRGYLGDYQKGESETAWVDYQFRLHQNQNRFGVSLATVEAEIRREYEASLQTLRPIKQQLARTDALIDQIVYQLYGLTEAEIELIERPAYEQALAEAKAAVQQDKELKDDADKAFTFVTERIEPAAIRLNALAPSDAANASLDAHLPNWRKCSDRVRTFLLQAERDYLDLTRIEYSGSQLNYAKSVEVSLTEYLFEPFRDAGFTDDDVQNEEMFKPYMRREKKLTLGSMTFLFSRKEKTFRSFTSSRHADADTRIFNSAGLMGLLSSDQIVARNGGAHENVISRDVATEARAWAFAVLGLVG